MFDDEVLGHTTTVESIPRPDIKKHDKRVARVAHTLFIPCSIDDLFIPLPLIATNQTKFATNRH